MAPWFKQAEAEGFRNWRLTVDGLVARPTSFSVADLQALGRRSQITEVVCEEGWSYIAEWIGTPLSAVLREVGVLPEARYIGVLVSRSGPVGQSGHERGAASADAADVGDERRRFAGWVWRAAADAGAAATGLQEHQVRPPGDGDCGHPALRERGRIAGASGRIRLVRGDLTDISKKRSSFGGYGKPLL